MISIGRYTFIGVMIAFLGLTTVSVSDAAPTGKNHSAAVQRELSPEKEALIEELAGMPVEAVFANLKLPEFYIDRKLLLRAAYVSLNPEKQKAVSYALSLLSRPIPEEELSDYPDQSLDLRVAKAVLSVFPEMSTPRLVKLYYNGNAVTRGNVVKTAGGMDGGAQIEKLLIDALFDREFCEASNPEISGEPMRVCDVAYNQIVLRYSIKNVLRSLGPSYRLEVRDHHIGELINRIQSDS